MRYTYILLLVLFIVSFSFLSAQATISYYSPVTVTATTNGVTVSWSSVNHTNGQIEYGLSNSYGQTITDNNGNRGHDFSVTGLLSNTTYYYRVTVIELDGTSLTNQYSGTFTTWSSSTPPPSPTPPPPSPTPTPPPPSPTPTPTPPPSGTILYQNNLNSFNYGIDCRAGGTHIWLSSSGWDGGGIARFTPTTQEGNSCGISGINWPGYSPQTVSVRYVFKPGPNLYSSNWGAKMLILSRNPYSDSTRFIATMSKSASFDGSSIEQVSLGRNILWDPDTGVSPGFYIEDFANQWVSTEYYVDVITNTLRMYFTTRDGSYNDFLVMESTPNGCKVWNTRRNQYVTTGCSSTSFGSGYWDGIPILAGFHAGGSPSTSGVYYDIDDIAISSSHAGPPSGFVNTTPPPPSGAITPIFKMDCENSPLNCGWGYVPAASPYYTITHMEDSGPFSGIDAVRFNHTQQPAGTGQVQYYNGWGKSISATTQGATRYIRFWIKPNSPVNFSGTGDWWSSKFIILGDGGDSTSRVICNLRDDYGSVGANGTRMAIQCSRNIDGGTGVALIPDQWNFVQIEVKSSTSETSTDGSIKVWLNSNNYSSPTVSPWTGDLPTRAWNNINLGWYANTAVASNGRINFDLGGFEWDDQFDTAWYPSGTSNPPPPPPPTPVVGDINLDHVVNSLDWSVMNSQWFTSNSQSDLRVDGQVNSLDFAILSSNWGRTW